MKPGEARTRVVSALARQLADWGAPEPELKASELLAVAESHGWRYRPEVVERPQPGERTARSQELARQARESIRRAVDPHVEDAR